jgi:uncharacterized protein YoaH (UPF0181 family)
MTGTEFGALIWKAGDGAHQEQQVALAEVVDELLPEGGLPIGLAADVPVQRAGFPVHQLVSVGANAGSSIAFVAAMEVEGQLLQCLERPPVFQGVEQVS